MVLSFFVAVFSTITYLSRPGEMIRYGPLTLAGFTALPLIYWIVGWYVIPVFKRLNVTSGNELLEAAFDWPSGRRPCPSTSACACCGWR